MQSKKLVLLVILSLVGSVFGQGIGGACQGYDAKVAEKAVHFAGCSCVLNNYTTEINNWSYEQCLAAQSDPNKMQDITIFHSKVSNMLAFVAYDSEKNWTVVSFRATVCDQKGEDIVVDLDKILVKYNEWGCSNKNCRIHQGFYLGYKSLLLQGFDQKVFAVAKERRSEKILITGISLGGGLAAIAAYDLHRKLQSRYNVESLAAGVMVYTFGEPRIGNQYLVEEINSIAGLYIYRVVLEKDPVPHLPPRLNPLKGNQTNVTTNDPEFQYFHPGYEVFYKFSDQSAKPVVSAGDNNLCESNKITYDFKFNGCNHMEYPNLSRKYPDLECIQTSTNRNNFNIPFVTAGFEEVAAIKFLTALVRKQVNCNTTSIPTEIICKKKNDTNTPLFSPQFTLLLPPFVYEIMQGASLPSEFEKYSDQVEKMFQGYLGESEDL